MSVTYGLDPKSQRITVYYEGSNTIYEGMALCYNNDTTTNWLGKSSADLTAESTTTAEGYQNEGKFIRVEEPSSTNKAFFAGVVAGSGKSGKAGPCVLDIYIPNGAIVPVHTDKSVSVGEKMYLEDGENTLINISGLPCVGIFTETVDRGSAAGLALARLERPALSEELPATTLGIGLSPTLWADCPIEQLSRDPGLGIHFFSDFMDEVDVTTGDGWTLTLVDTKGSLGVEAVAAGGVLALTSATGDSADDGIQAQLKNCAIKPVAGVDIWCEMRVKVSDATQQWFAGFAAVDTTLIASGVIDDASDKVGFFHHAASTDNKVSSITARTSADDATADVAAMVDDTWKTIGFKITGITTVDFYVNGVLVESGALTANVPNAGMCLSLVSQYETVDNILSVDWIKLATLGGRDA